MKKNLFRFSGAAVLGILFLYAGCKKDSGYYDHQNIVKEFEGNTYEFLKSQPGVYDSFLYIIDKVGLSDSLKDGNYTLFAPTNASFQEAISNMNNLRKAQGRPMLYLATSTLSELDSMASQYLIPGIIPADSLATQDGIDLYSAKYQFRMHGRYKTTRSEGYIEGGPGVIEYSNTKGVVYTRQWSTSTTVAVNIKTSNGVVNVMDRNHIFGFDEFIGRINPTLPMPYYGYPLAIPGIIGFELFDKGGESVAYHDNSAKNEGGQFRSTEGVDIMDAEDGYAIGWTNSNEWMKYTVLVAEEAEYRLLIRAKSNRQSNQVSGTIHLELDDQTVTNNIKIMGSDNNWVETEVITRNLKAGKHVLKIMYDLSGFDLRYMRFMPLDRPYPVPGTIPAEEFNQGGEGVGYHDADANNNGGAYRTSEGVDIGRNKEGGGFNVGWTSDNEWMDYTINVLKAGDYLFTARVASPNEPNGNNRFHFEIDGENVTGAMTCPNTGAWDAWKNISASKTVHLEKGIHTMRFYLENGNYNIRSYTISEFK